MPGRGTTLLASRVRLRGERETRLTRLFEGLDAQAGAIPLSPSVFAPAPLRWRLRRCNPLSSDRRCFLATSTGACITDASRRRLYRALSGNRLACPDIPR